eukprot:TRINITY_DN1785_c1_g1_i1.p1 TRINITY_DN1785_c1_g1~~TRINITY_DN1785_c1_g1_i1.p1  ORF type:complete len:328 (+),score=90.53 TRINITY_DN1785_c1_g1_i1:52-984(+)
MADRMAKLRARIKAKEEAAAADRQAKFEAAKQQVLQSGEAEKQAQVQKEKDAAAEQAAKACLESVKKQQAATAAEQPAVAAAAAARGTGAAKRQRLDASAAEMPTACRCGLPLECKVVNKEGANKGRRYLACPRGRRETGGCDFFAWAPPGFQGSTESAAAAAAVRTECNCGLSLEIRTVTKEGPNTGRSYQSCPKGKKEFGGCGFFAWVDAAAAACAPPAAEACAADLAAAAFEAPPPKCRCGVAAEWRSVQRDGPHRGRQYASCARGGRSTGGCGLFEWRLGVAPEVAQRPVATPVSATRTPLVCAAA